MRKLTLALTILFAFSAVTYAGVMNPGESGTNWSKYVAVTNVDGNGQTTTNWYRIDSTNFTMNGGEFDAQGGNGTNFGRIDATNFYGYYNGDGGGLTNITAFGADEKNIIYVGGHGQPVGPVDGKSVEEAYVDIQNALIGIGAGLFGTPDETNRIVIRVVDAGIYGTNQLTPDICIPPFVSLDAPNATVLNRIILSNSSARVKTLRNDFNGDAVWSAVGTNAFWAEQILATGTVDAIQNDADLLFIDIGEIRGNIGQGILNTSGSKIWGEIDRMYFSGPLTAGAAIWNNGDILARIGSINMVKTQSIALISTTGSDMLIKSDWIHAGTLLQASTNSLVSLFINTVSATNHYGNVAGESGRPEPNINVLNWRLLKGVADVKMFDIGTNLVSGVGESVAWIDNEGDMWLKGDLTVASNTVVIGDQAMSSSDVLNFKQAYLRAGFDSGPVDNQITGLQIGLALNKASDLRYQSRVLEGYNGAYVDSFSDLSGVRTNLSTNLTWQSNSNFIYNATVPTQAWSITDTLSSALAFTNAAAATNADLDWFGADTTSWQANSNFSTLVATQTPGAFASSYGIDGAATYIYFQTNSTGGGTTTGMQMLNPGTNLHAWSYWVYPISSSANESPHSFQGNGSQCYYRGMFVDGAGLFRCTWRPESGAGYDISEANGGGQFTLSFGTWHHIVVQRTDGHTFDVWADGVKASGYTNAGTPLGTFDYSYSSDEDRKGITFGTHLKANATHRMNGYITGVLYAYKDVWSDDEIIGLYNSGVGTTGLVDGAGVNALDMQVTSTNLPVLSPPTDIKLIMTVRDIDNITSNDVFANVSRDGGTTFYPLSISQAGLVSSTNSAEKSKVFWGRTSQITNGPSGTQIVWTAGWTNSLQGEMHDVSSVFE